MPEVCRGILSQESAKPPQTLVHLVYVHGFQGDNTSFQSFPMDLQQYLTDHIPLMTLPNVKFQSSLYPTYKSRKPIAEATHNFLAWLTTQPPGPVILMGHSMGGLLAADAATDSSNVGPAKSRRILGVVAFDVPYLGMHPHVVVSGLSSLFPEKSADKPAKEADMNRHSDVKIVDKQVTDDWDAFKRKTDAERSRSGSHSPLPASPSPSSPPARSALDKTVSFLSTHANGKIGTWLQKHTNDPFTAGTRFVVEYFQFGSSMFDPSELKDRYSRLVRWQDGLWVNYWTQVPRPTVLKEGDDGLLRAPTMDSMQSGASLQTTDSELSHTGTDTSSAPPTPPAAHADEPSPTDESSKTKKKDKHKDKAKAKSHHFIVLPTGLGEHLGGREKWEKVIISGVPDEVAAHTGLFIRASNPDYEQLVERVAGRVLGWCEVISR
ncbi:hypothetical protein C8F01DRAFT_973826 [Mycena amicta]|nr:hypothetical protein C8F01DRAFT_973826 [Mycena amicta]